MENLTITNEAMQMMVQYLSRQPYNEVRHIFEKIETDTVNASDKLEQTKEVD